MNPSEVFERTFSMTEIAKGKLGSCFALAQTGKPVFVIKNNAPYRIVITPEDYAILEKARENEV